GIHYTVTVTGMTQDGTVTASVRPAAAKDAAGNDSLASTSTDNTVTFDTTAPTVAVNQAAGQPDPTRVAAVWFTIVFSEPVFGSSPADVKISGSAGATTAQVIDAGDHATYAVLVTGMAQDGTVRVDLQAGAATDAAGNPSADSTSADNV